jgi:hypothetical protein
MPARVLTAALAWLALAAGGTARAGDTGAGGGHTPTAWELASLACQELGDRALVALIPEGAGDGYVCLLLGERSIYIGPCGMAVATAIKFNRPADLGKTDVYVRSWGLVSVSYRCDERFRLWVTKVEVRSILPGLLRGR